PIDCRALRRTLLAVRNTDETGASPSQTATRQRNCLYFQLTYKKLERGRFIWPSAADGTVVITPAQLGYLLEGIDWRMPQKTWRPSSAG
ncbi:hypothetical protein C5748_26320, partial [Phyllobacterium phragmitis]